MADKVAANVLVDREDENFYIDPSGTSLVQDIALASRGNLRLSDLLTRMVLIRSDWVKNNDLVTKPVCGGSGAYAGNPKNYSGGSGNPEFFERAWD
ncbi:MAG: hypothetical protein Q9M92_00550 [Enterobacterales bacterium]|nr:hypothetical protein [Enterobacterales bacterium]